jgi:hypothetical protein
VNLFVEKDLNFALHHDNAQTHMALSVNQFLTQKSIAEMEHPLCFSDLASNVLSLFPNISLP